MQTIYINMAKRLLFLNIKLQLISRMFMFCCHNSVIFHANVKATASSTIRSQGGTTQLHNTKHFFFHVTAYQLFVFYTTLLLFTHT